MVITTTITSRCRISGVPVLNINELANALKPVVCPEEMLVQVIKDGRRWGRVAYRMTEP